MALAVVKGKISRVTKGVTVGAGGASLAGNAYVSAVQTISMLIGTTPAQLEMSSVPIINDGDAVVTIGDLNNGMLKVMAMRNETAGVEYNLHPAGYANVMYIFTGVCVIFGLMTINVFGLGYLSLLTAIFTFVVGRQRSKIVQFIKTGLTQSSNAA